MQSTELVERCQRTQDAARRLQTDVTEILDEMAKEIECLQGHSRLVRRHEGQSGGEEAGALE